MAHHSTATNLKNTHGRKGSNMRKPTAMQRGVCRELKKKKTARIAALQGRPICDELRRGIRAYRATVRPTTEASPNKLLFRQELRGKLQEARRQSEHPDDATVRNRDREQKKTIKKYVDKRRHTSAMRIKVGCPVLCK